MAYESMRGDNNPMKRASVAAKQAASLRKTWKDPERRKDMLAYKEAMPWLKRKPEKVPKSRAWSEERKAAHSAGMKAYWARVKEALDAHAQSTP